ncbi:lysylphosphatidylglycerol synthase transmembrane domain-containing protein [Actinomadura sp. NPDC047616]|uniref:lysylphosphatidylglycerol synthase transmembrane domain-containing protein n=1 Tax=Actinomadura sp. NPDC047616 TaxID=3155914 RepID=UPI003406D95E
MGDVVTAPAPAARESAPVAPEPSSRRRGIWVQLGVLALTVGALAAFRDRLPDFGAMWGAARRAEPGWLAVAVLAAAGSMGAFARLQRRLLRIGGLRISLRRAFAVTYAGNALSTTLPAGPALSVVYTFRQFRRSGASARLATAVILLGGVITTTAYTVIGLAALIADPRARTPVLLALGAAAVLAGAVAVAALRAGVRARIVAFGRRCVRRVVGHRRIAPYVERLWEGRQVLRPSRRDWAALVVLAMLNWVFDIVALHAAALAVGVELAPQAVVLAYFAAQAAGSVLPVLPGGLGAIESSMAGALVAFGAALIPAGAAVGLYRLVSYWGVVAVGWLAWVVLHEGPRLSEGTRRRLAALGDALLRGCSSVVLLLPYSVPPGMRGAEPRNG